MALPVIECIIVFDSSTIEHVKYMNILFFQEHKIGAHAMTAYIHIPIHVYFGS